MGDGTREAPDPARTGATGTPGLLPEVFALTRRLRRPLYGTALAVTLFAACGVGAIAVLGFALAWDAFALFREHVQANLLREDPPFSALGDIEVTLRLVGILVVGLLLVLLTAVVALLSTAHTVAVRRAPRETGLGGLGREARPYLLRVLATRWPPALGAVAAALLAARLFDRLAHGLVPGVERPRAPFTGFDALDWVVGLGPPFLAACVGPYLLARLSLAGAVVVFEDVRAGRALRRSWALTRGARAQARAGGVWLLVAAAVALAFALLLYAAMPLALPAEAAMMRLSGENVFTSATLAHYLPAAAALVLLPVAVGPPACVLPALLYTRLRAREEGGHTPAGVPPAPSGTG